MAKEEDYLIRKFGIEKPFKTPEGYFDSFTEKMMEKLPEKVIETKESNVVTLWDRVKPLVYLAAMFAGIAAMFAVAEDFVSETPQQKNEVNVLSATSSEFDELPAVYSDAAADYCSYMMLDNNIDDYSMYQYLENTVE